MIAPLTPFSKWAVIRLLMENKCTYCAQLITEGSAATYHPFHWHFPNSLVTNQRTYQRSPTPRFINTGIWIMTPDPARAPPID